MIKSVIIAVPGTPLIRITVTLPNSLCHKDGNLNNGITVISETQLFINAKLMEKNSFKILL